MALPANSSSGIDDSVGQVLIPRTLMADYEWTFYVDAVMAYLGPAIVLLGMVTNIINLTVFRGQGLRDGVTLSLFTLAFSDFALCVLLFGAGTTTMVRTFEPGHVLDPDSFMVACFGHTRSAAYCYSTCVTVYLSIERSLCVTLPFKFKTMFTRNVTLVVILTLAACVLALYLPVLATQGLHWRFDPRYNKSRVLLWRRPNVATIHLVQVVTTSFMIPIAAQVIIGVSTGLMIYGLQASTRFKEKSGSGSTAVDAKGESLPGKEIKAVKMVLYLSIVFFVCNLPLVASAIARISMPELDLHGRLAVLYKTTIGFVLMISGINASINFFVYYFHSSRFKEVFHKTFKVC